mmetsp:Transcript_57411/g.121817  ORF Transcript_57411/g.121817 Transcript_57411/m.121817 type:complete len:210 (+) Transcript_57411:455-1084(+)
MAGTFCSHCASSSWVFFPGLGATSSWLSIAVPCAPSPTSASVLPCGCGRSCERPWQWRPCSSCLPWTFQFFSRYFWRGHAAFWIACLLFAFSSVPPQSVLPRLHAGESLADGPCEPRNADLRRSFFAFLSVAEKVRCFLAPASLANSMDHLTTMNARTTRRNRPAALPFPTILSTVRPLLFESPAWSFASHLKDTISEAEIMYALQIYR